ncbi:MAG: photosystem II stability/assembly factor-like uncharacterized protein [Crocinitomicaceae bacterium]|jgi:photosystem II stability/assembly factor-like uncharacterized protein
MKNILLLLVTISLTLSVNAQTWNQIQTGTTKNLYAIDFPSANIGYIGGDSSILLKTIDGGQTWAEMPVTGASNPDLYQIVDIDFVSETTGYISNDYGGTYITVDGGINWTPFGNLASNMCYSQTMYIDNQDHLFMGGAGCFQGAMIEEYDAGTWNSVLNDPIFWNADHHVKEISFGDANIGLAAVKNEYILRTTDAGASWDSIRIDLLGVDAYLTSVKMVDNLVAFAGYNDNGGGFGILRTSDGGLTWIQDMNSATFYYPSFNCVHIASNGDVYSGTTPSTGPNGVIFESIDGINWTYEDVDESINGMSSYGSDVTFAVGDSGYLVVNTLPSSLALDEQSYSELSIFPNPVKDELFVDVSADQKCEIQVFNSLGMALKIPMNLDGKFKQLDVSKLSKGAYLLKIQGENGVRTVKFVKKD